MFVTKRSGEAEPFYLTKIHDICKYVCNGLSDVDAELLANEVSRQVYPGIHTDTIYDIIVLTARTMMVNDDPNYSYVAARTLLLKLNREVVGKSIKDADKDKLYRTAFVENIKLMVEEGLLSDKLLKFDLGGLSEYLKLDRDDLIQYPGAQTLYDRYFINKDGRRLESLQGFFMRVAMGLSINETDGEAWAKRFYDKISLFKYLPSSPTLFNAGTQRSQLSSCFLSTVPDDLEGIFGAIYSQAMLSKWAGGLALDWSYVRAINSHIKKTNGKSQGVIPWMKIYNDMLISTNQGGKRKGSGCSYLETWHLEIEEFLELRKNTGDDRRRCRDMNTSNWIPDLFIERVQEDGDWYLFCPSEATDLHDLYGAEFKEKYIKYCQLADEGQIKNFKILKAKSLWRKMLTALVETGHPWICYKDPCNIRYTAKNVGVVHSSNLCCISQDQRVPTQFGILTVGELYKLKEKLQVVGREKIEAASEMLLPRPDAPIVNIVTREGYNHKVTPDHKVWVKDIGWVEAKDLKEWDLILIQQIEGLWGPEDLQDEAFIAGLVAGDGNIIDKGPMNVDLWDGCIILIPEVESCIHRIIKKYENLVNQNGRDGFYTEPRFNLANTDNSNCVKYRLGSSRLRFIFEDKFNFNSETKLKVPEFVWKGNKKTVSAYLKGLYFCDSTIQAQNKEKDSVTTISLSSVNRKFLEEIQILLANFAIKSSLCKMADEGSRELPDGKGGKKFYDCQDSWRLLITSIKGCRLFHENTGLGFISYHTQFLENIEKDGYKQKLYCTFSHLQTLPNEDAYCVQVDSLEHSWTVNGLITKNTEITLHTTPTLWVNQVKDNDSETAVCNLASPNIAAHFKGEALDWDELKDTIKVMTRGLDNVIDLNFYPIDSTRRANQSNRPVGLGLMGLADALQLMNLEFDSQEAISFSNNLQEFISFYSIETSCELAQERGKYPTYEGSDWSKGIFPVDTYVSLMKYRDSNHICNKYLLETLPGWDNLRKQVAEHGVRNSNLIAIAPNACQLGTNKIKTNDGIKSIYDILKENDINTDAVEKENKPHWIHITPFKVPTLNGEQTSNKIWFNGKQEIYEIEFEDGNKYSYTGNHKLLVKCKNGKQEWKQVRYLTEDDEIVSV